MSTLRIVDQAETAWLTLITDVDMTLRLFTNDVTSGLTDSEIDALTEAAFTEATFTGYAAASITTAWTVTAGNPSTATQAEVTFTRTVTGTPQLIYGYYLTRNSDGALMWFEQLDGPVTVEFASDTVAVTPTLTLDDTEGHAVETGTITAYGGATAPTGWLLCDGSAVSRSTYAALFAVIGESYGAGDGSTTFNLPDLQQRFPLGLAASGTGATLGETGGAIDHTHGLDTASSGAEIYMTTTGNAIRMGRKSGLASYTTSHEVSTALTVVAGAAGNTLGASLTGDSDSENPPYQVVNYIIKAA